MDSVRDVFNFGLNWNPSYSYSELPKGYSYDSIPAHWKAMLHRVEPAEKGIPYAKDIYVENIKATNAQEAFVASGLDKSLLSNYVFTNCTISAATIGMFELTQGWKFNNLVLDISKKQTQLKASTEKSEIERLKN
ncbi:hypothetical protein F5148DRAFT_1296666 [Russula earlei]|uniref:Uncharacterized protein n=1 Tax=Russula earlei TaxID=71964 RepID=A0ACC0TRG2_9AGAM|nr:hypothetical protein F5148DRAFT_1296666 [Russula earlei]